ncbi:uncharacterized protein LOC123293812 isoform X2 [Chrysoperla carnea]|uniref:uncharacterized protein LOC123293812 isoform X2 n=1 Tax=Chrysoperla carnea TaxID=189513 RepID=UPI001D06B2DF|nr:uncharacterized protein LOC123293812 isoform X2 [Chrysoperla carnea]
MNIFMKICDNNGSIWRFYLLACLIIFGLGCVYSAPVLPQLQDSSVIPVDVYRNQRDTGSVQGISQLLPGLPLPIDLQTIQKILQIITSLGQQIFNPTRMFAGLFNNSNDEFGSDGGKYNGPFPLMNRLTQMMIPAYNNQ